MTEKEKENADLKWKLENRREKIGFGIDELSKFNHCKDVDPDSLKPLKKNSNLVSSGKG